MGDYEFVRGLATVNQASLSVVAPSISEALMQRDWPICGNSCGHGCNRYSAQVEIIMNRFEAFTEEFGNILSRAAKRFDHA